MKSTSLLLALTTVSTLAQGPLLPPAAPAPSMKTLAQIEARTPIPASSAVPIAGPHFTITQPGSYYLTGNVQVASGNGILIGSSNVTLDLNGFALISTTVIPAGGTAILIGAAVCNVQIKNGSITGGALRTAGSPVTYAQVGWFRGVDSSTSTSSGFQLNHLTVERCKSDGINLTASATLDHITANGNGGYGISANYGSVTHSTASACGSAGIFGNFASVSNSTASNNGNFGIYVPAGSVSHCTAANNGTVGILATHGSVNNSTATSNGSDGIHASGGSVSNCRATANSNTGILVGLGVAAHCVASANDSSGGVIDKQIDVSIGGQRVACVPASE